MKTRSLLLITLLPLVFGCQILRAPETLQAIAGLAEDAARVATRIDLEENPDHRDAFIEAKGILDDLVQSTNITITTADLRAILAELPIQDGIFRGTRGILLIEGSLIVLNIATLFGYDVQSEAALLLVARSIRDGIAAGLAATAPAQARIPKRTKRTPIPKPIPKRIIPV